MVRKRKRSSTIAIGKVHLIYSSGIFLHVPACPLDQNMKHYKQSINTWILAESAKETLQFLTGQMNSLVAGSRLIVVVRDTSKLTLTVFCVHIRLWNGFDVIILHNVHPQAGQLWKMFDNY